jgi:preprotein translocase subunit SecA
VKKSQKLLSLTNLFSFASQRYNFLLHNALKVLHFFHRDIDYVVVTDKIILIDSLTGRLVPNRVYGSGIHQAIESKENLPVGSQSKTIATITYQNFFRLFTKLAGMTGTAQSEAKEFREVYGMEVISVPPYRKLIRQDHDALIFLNCERKYQAIIRQVKKNVEKTGRPILIICPSVDVSEQISHLLTQKRIFHNKLNAVNHEEEAKIIAEAGKIGTVTVATNMAGRGTDISLDEASRQAGGLLVIIAEMNSILRIDNQARGRSGRQGDPGETQPYISLDDDLLKNFDISKKLGGIFGQRQLKEVFHQPLSGKLFNYLISEPQETLRNNAFGYRQHTLNHDLLINQQRKIVYNYREKLLTSPHPEKIISPTGKVDFTESQERLRPLLLGRVDDFWSEYLECLSKIGELVKVRY